MDARKIKEYNAVFVRHFPPTLPPMAWYFSPSAPQRSIEMPSEAWNCMFKYLADVANNKALCFSQKASGCGGASCYFGFSKPHKNAGSFLAEKEKFKEKAQYGNEFYKQIEAKKPKEKYLILNKIENIADNYNIEVVNYWVTPLTLSGLVTLSNFDSPINDNASIPFASGCQSMWTIPYKEMTRVKPRSTIGALDPAMRKYIPDDSLLFSVPANRFVELSKNIKNSFANTVKWSELITKKA